MKLKFLNSSASPFASARVFVADTPVKVSFSGMWMSESLISPCWYLNGFTDSTRLSHLVSQSGFNVRWLVLAALPTFWLRIRKTNELPVWQKKMRRLYCNNLQHPTEPNYECVRYMEHKKDWFLKSLFWTPLCLPLMFAPLLYPIPLRSLFGFFFWFEVFKYEWKIQLFRRLE